MNVLRKSKKNFQQLLTMLLILSLVFTSLDLTAFAEEIQTNIDVEESSENEYVIEQTNNAISIGTEEETEQADNTISVEIEDADDSGNEILQEDVEENIDYVEEITEEQLLFTDSEEEIVAEEEMIVTEPNYGLSNPRKDASGNTVWDCVWFGNYFQSNADTKEPIKWRVLSISDNQAFLLADKNLDCKPYNTTYSDVTWEGCTLRSWLNGYDDSYNVCGTDFSNDNFMKVAFNESEQNSIIRVLLENMDSPVYGIDGGNNTNDYIFCISLSDSINPNFGFSYSRESSDLARVAVDTSYISLMNSKMGKEGEAEWWWLRSPGNSTKNFEHVESDGVIRGYNSHNYPDRNAVRPALYLDLSDTTVWSKAGTVNADGTIDEIEKKVSYGLSAPRKNVSDNTVWDCVWFGNYWQKDTNGDGISDKNDNKEPIKWRILSISDNNALLLADKSLDCKQYNLSKVSITWEESTIRSWLNGYGNESNKYGNDYSADNFISTAFEDNEKNSIIKTRLITANNGVYGTQGGNITEDKIFLLSVEDALNESYGFSVNKSDNDEARWVYPTQYALDCGARVSSDVNYAGNAWWWLRSPGRFQYDAANVYYAGYIPDIGDYSSYDHWTVRPALYLDLSDTTVWSKAGTVCSDGTIDEIKKEENTNSLRVTGKFTYKMTTGFVEGSEDAEWVYDFDYSIFQSTPSNVYNHELALMSLKVTMTSNNTNSIRKMFDNLEMEYTDESSTMVDPGVDTIGTAMAHKKICYEDGSYDDIVLVAIRSCEYSSEWTSNAQVDLLGNHGGFDSASEQALQKLEKYLDSENLDGNNTKIWITGFSRGAATSNLLAAKLNQGRIEGITASNVYAYCFECPQCTTDINAHTDSYSNIINIINNADIVTKVAMDTNNWYFQRYGVDYILPNILNNRLHYISLRGGMKDAYRDILNLKYTEGNETYSSLLYEGTYSIEDIIRIWAGNNTLKNGTSEMLLYNLTLIIPNRLDYYLFYQDLIMDAVNVTMGGGEESINLLDVIIAIARYCAPNIEPGKEVGRIGILYSILGYGIINDKILHLTTNKNVSLMDNYTSIISPHYPELSLAWLESIDGIEAFETDSCKYKKVFVNCPVDVEVYDSEGVLVAAIYDDQVIDIEDGIVCYIDNDGQKIFAVGEQEDFTIKYLGNGEGEMTCTVLEYEGVNSNPITVESFQNLQLYEGCEYTGSSISGNIIIKDSEGKSISSDTILTKDNIQQYEVSCNMIGDGSLTKAGGFYYYGEFCELEAKDTETYTFKNWTLNGIVISEEPYYRFMVSDNHLFTANYTKKYSITTVSSNYGKILPGSANLLEGESKEFIIKPETNYVIDDVLVDGTSIGNVNKYIFENVSCNHVIEVKYAPTHLISTSSVGSGNVKLVQGTIVEDTLPEGVVRVKEGQDLEYRIVPDKNAVLIDVIVNGISEGPIDSYIFTGIESSQELIAIFDDTYSIQSHGKISLISGNYVAIGDNSGFNTESISNNIIVAKGETISYRIEEIEDCLVNDVLIDGKSVGKISEYTFADISANHIIEVKYVPIYTISAMSSDYGNIKVTKGNIISDNSLPQGVSRIREGENLEYEITPDKNFLVEDVLVDGKSKGAITKYSFQNISDNHVIEAIFIPTYTISASIVGNGNVTLIEGNIIEDKTLPEGTVRIKKNEKLKYIFEPEKNNLIENVLIDGKSVGKISEYTFTDISANHIIEVKYISTYTISAMSSDNGNIKVTKGNTISDNSLPIGVLRIKEGESLEYEITPDKGFLIEDVLVDGKSKGTITNYCFQKISENHVIEAKFMPTFTVSTAVVGDGTITLIEGDIIEDKSLPEGTIRVKKGEKLKYSITPGNDTVLVDVLVNGKSQGISENLIISDITESCVITALFTNYYSIDSKGKFESVSGNILEVGGNSGFHSDILSNHILIKEGETVTYHIIAEAGFIIDKVLVDGENVGAVEYYTFNKINNNHTIEVEYKKIIHVISTKGENGKLKLLSNDILINDMGSFNEEADINKVFMKEGDKVTYQIIPDKDYVIKDVLIDGKSVGVRKEYCFENIKSDHTIEAYFEYAYPYVTVKQKYDVSEFFKDIKPVKYVVTPEISGKLGGKASVTRKGILTAKRAGVIYVMPYIKEGRKIIPAPNVNPLRIDIINATYAKDKMTATYIGQEIYLNDLLPEIGEKQDVTWQLTMSKKKPPVSYDEKTKKIIAVCTGNVRLTAFIQNDQGYKIKISKTLKVIIPKLSVKEQITLKSGKSKIISLTKVTKGKSVTWNTSDDNVVSIVTDKKNSAKVKLTAISKGEAIVTAVVDGQEYSVTITVP